MIPVQVGDIILYRCTPTSSIIDKVISWGEGWLGELSAKKEQYVHASLVGPDTSSLYEAVWPRSHKIAINWPKLLSKNIIDVYRIKNITPIQVGAMVRYCNQNTPKWYGLTAICTFGVVQFGSSVYCSLLIWRAALAAGIVLWPYEALETPDDLSLSTQMDFIGTQTL